MMKQRLLLLMCVLATTLCAKAYTVTFDVKFGSFMTEKKRLSFDFDGNSIQYDESTGKYVVSNTNAGTHRYDVSYPNMLKLYVYDLKINSDTIISLDFTDYHKATFKAPDGYNNIQSLIVYYGDNYEYTFDDFYESAYMPDGSYKCAAELRSIETKYTYLNTDKQIFTIEGVDKDILININPNNFHKVDFSFTDRSGEAANCYIMLRDNENRTHEIYLPKEHKTMMLKDGYYSCSFEVNNYPNIKKGFTVAGKDMEISASYENYKKLTIQLTGSILSQLGTKTLTLKNKANNESVTLYPEKISDTEYSKVYYFEPGVIEYQFQSNEYNHPTALKTGETVLNQDTTLTIDLSDCHLITFKPVDIEGNPISTNQWGDLTITTESGSEFKSGLTNLNFYIQQGKHTASIRLGSAGSSKYTYFYQNFTVTNEDQEVKLVCDESQYNKVDINIKNMPKDMISKLSCQIQLFSGDHIYSEEHLFSSETGKIFLPNGTYEYRVARGKNNAIGIVPLTGTVTVSGIFDHIDLDFSQYGMTIVELKDTEGLPIENDGTEHRFSLNKDGYMTNAEIGFQSNDITLLAPAGTYLFSAYVNNCGTGEKSVNITAGTLTTETLTLTPRQSNKFIVSIGTNIANCKISLQDYGSIMTTDDHEACFYNINATDKLMYEASAPGYKTIKGAIVVNNTWAYNGIIQTGVTMKLDSEPIAIETVKADNSFRVYPTIADDYINISTNNQDETAWTIRLTSATGASVYMDKLVLDGEEQIYVGNLPKGFYLLTLNNGEQRMTYKILKK